MDQLSLFNAPSASIEVPEGFLYQPDLVTPQQERELVDVMQSLPFENFKFGEYEGRRRVISFGWKYDFNTGELRRRALGCGTDR